MWKVFTPVLGASLLLSLPALAGDPTGLPIRPPRLPNPGLPPVLPPDHIKKTTIAEVKGVLRRVEVPGEVREGFPIHDKKGRKGIWRHVFEITAAGKTYRLDLSASRHLAVLAKRLVGKTVLAVGPVEDRTFWHRADDKDGVALMILPEEYRALVVRRLEVIETEAARETVEVEVQGVLSYRSLLEVGPDSSAPSRRWAGYVVTAGRQEFRLDLGSNPRLAEIARQSFGLPVVVTGRLETRVVLLNLSGATRTYQVIVVTGLNPLELCGTKSR